MILGSNRPTRRFTRQRLPLQLDREQPRLRGLRVGPATGDGTSERLRNFNRQRIPGKERRRAGCVQRSRSGQRQHSFRHGRRQFHCGRNWLDGDWRRRRDGCWRNLRFGRAGLTRPLGKHFVHPGGCRFARLQTGLRRMRTNATIQIQLTLPLFVARAQFDVLLP